MGSFSRTKSSIAAVAATALMLSGMAPATAEPVNAATDISAKSSPVKHRHMTHVRHVGHVAAVTPLQRNLGCSGEWCGRQFVLIVGIGF